MSRLYKSETQKLIEKLTDEIAERKEDCIFLNSKFIEMKAIIITCRDTLEAEGLTYTKAYKEAVAFLESIGV